MHWFYSNGVGDGSKIRFSVFGGMGDREMGEWGYYLSMSRLGWTFRGGE